MKSNNLIKEDNSIKYIDYLKAIGLLCVVLAHVKPPEIIYQIRIFDVPLLIVLSGYLSRISDKTFGTISEVVGYYFKRFKRLIVPAWLFLILYFAYQFSRGEIYGKGYYLKSFFLTSYGYGYVWIVLVFSIIAACVPLFQKIKDKKVTWIVLLLLYSIYEVLCAKNIGVSNMIYSTIVNNAIPYSCIAFLGFKYIDLTKKSKIVIILSSLAIFIASELFYYLHNGQLATISDFKYPARIFYLSYGIVISFSLLYLFEYVLNKHEHGLDCIFSWISRHSYQLYWFHISVIVILDDFSILQHWLIRYIVILGISIFLVKLVEFIRNKGRLIPMIIYSFLILGLIGWRFIYISGATYSSPINTSVKRVEVYRENELSSILNYNLRYILNNWWNSGKNYVFASGTTLNSDKNIDVYRREQILESQNSFLNWKDNEIINIYYLDNNHAENSIRPISHAVYCISTSLFFDYYDENIVGITKDQAYDMCIVLLRSVVNLHESNFFLGWGKTWQSALWTENLGIGAWLMWDRLDLATQKSVSKMIIEEANNILFNYRIPYYKDLQGNILSLGDTKAEEIAWNTKILALASEMFPEHRNAERWRFKLKDMLISATVRPVDLENNSLLIQEYSVQGTNINNDGTVINHGLHHVDYMTTILEEYGDSLVVYLLSGRIPPKEISFNLDKIYNALVTVDLGEFEKSKKGKHFYNVDSVGNPLQEVIMPEINDWGGNWYANYYLADVIAEKLELDSELDSRYKAHVWGKLHLKRIKAMVFMQNESKVLGQFFQDDENNFVSGELFQMHNLTEAYIIQQISDPDRLLFE